VLAEGMSTPPPPFPWFGGKEKVASQIWQRLGNPNIYIEPFAGALSVLLARPHQPVHEVVNDLDGWLVNFWRAVQWQPHQLVEWADWPRTEIDLHARFRWFQRQDEGALIESLAEDPTWCDPKAAGWWVWGQCCSIAGNWLITGSENSRPNFASQRLSRRIEIGPWIRRLSERLRHVTVMCGNWARVCKPVTWSRRGTKAVLLDPPYLCRKNNRRAQYRVDDRQVAAEVAEWATEMGHREDTRIALCGVDGDYEMPDDWFPFRWATQGGMGNMVELGAGRRNSDLEILWFSPHCLSAHQLNLFEVAS